LGLTDCDENGEVKSDEPLTDSRLQSFADSNADVFDWISVTLSLMLMTSDAPSTPPDHIHTVTIQNCQKRKAKAWYLL